jgi:hypothetical protein
MTQVIQPTPAEGQGGEMGVNGFQQLKRKIKTHKNKNSTVRV